MQDGNVFIEAFTEKMSPRFIPVAGPEQIKEAFTQVTEANKLYVHDRQLAVPEEWLMAATLDFGDWLCDHIPFSNEASLCQMFKDVPFMDQYLMYAAGERVQDMQAELEEYGGIPHEIHLTAKIVANAISCTPSPMTISYVSGMDEVDTFYIPATDLDGVVDEHKVEEQVESAGKIPPTPRIVCWLECFHAAVRCLLHGGGAITVCVHEKDCVALGAVVLAAGRAWIISGAAAAKACMSALDGEDSVGRVISEFVPGCRLMAESRMLAACVAAAGADTMDAASRHLHKNDLDLVQAFSINPAVVSSDFDDNIHVYIVPVEVSSLPLPDLFDAVIDMDPFTTGIEASQCVLAAAVARGASEIILEGNMDATIEEVSEFASFVTLDTNNRPFDMDALGMLFECDEFREEIRTTDMMLEMYDELDEPRKAEINAIIDAVISDPSASKTVIFMEDEASGDGSVKAHSAYLPAGVPKEAVEEAMDRFKALCTKCLFSSNMRMLLAKRTSDNAPVIVSAVIWERGSWSNMGSSKIIELLESTNIGMYLGVAPGEPFDYRDIPRPR